MTRLLTSAGVVWLALLALAGCGDDVGEGELVGSLVVPDCRDGDTARWVCADAPIDQCDAFHLDLDFFALDQTGDSASLVMQRGGQILGRTDGLLFEIEDLRLLRGRLGRSIPVGPDSNVRAGLGLFERCPDTAQNFALSGTVVFEALGVERGERVSGRIERLEVRDGRSADGRPGPVLGFLRGDFDFTLRVGPPYQRFAQ